MKVGIEKGEEGELVDLPMRHHPAGVPIPPFAAEGELLPLGQQGPKAGEHLRHRDKAGDGAGEAHILAQFLQAVHEQLELAQVAHHGHQERPHNTIVQRARQPLVLIFVSREKVKDHTRGPHRREGKAGGYGQIVSHPGHNGRQLDQRGHHDPTIVIVVNVTASKPGVVRGEITALDDGVEIGQVHRLLAARHRMPEIGVAASDEPKEQEEEQKEQLVGYQQAPASAQILRQRPSLRPGDGGGDDHQQQQDAGNRGPRVGQKLEAGQQPGQVPQQQ